VERVAAPTHKIIGSVYTDVLSFLFLYQIRSWNPFKINARQRYLQAVVVLIVNFGWVVDLLA
jgi:hypothetical protein